MRYQQFNQIDNFQEDKLINKKETPAVKNEIIEFTIEGD